MKYIDLPLQHASDAVLKRMKRPGTRRSYERLLENIRARIPNVALRTTFIVGFPARPRGFRGARVVHRRDGFDHVGVFTYSHEEGTSAHALTDDVPAATKKKRQDALMARQSESSRRGSRPGSANGRGWSSMARLQSTSWCCGPAGRPGARHRPSRLPDRLRPGRFPDGAFIDVEIVGARLRSRRAPVIVSGQPSSDVSDLDRAFQRIFDDDQPTTLGSGWWSGAASVFLGALALAGVACFLSPDWLTTPRSP